MERDYGGGGGGYSGGGRDSDYHGRRGEYEDDFGGGDYGYSPQGARELPRGSRQRGQGSADRGRISGRISRGVSRKPGWIRQGLFEGLCQFARF